VAQTSLDRTLSSGTYAGSEITDDRFPRLSSGEAKMARRIHALRENVESIGDEVKSPNREA